MLLRVPSLFHTEYVLIVPIEALLRASWWHHRRHDARDLPTQVDEPVHHPSCLRALSEARRAKAAEIAELARRADKHGQPAGIEITEHVGVASATMRRGMRAGGHAIASPPPPTTLHSLVPTHSHSWLVVDAIKLS